MRIGIYVDVATEELRGVGYHIVNLVEALSKIDQQNEYLLYHQHGLWKSKSRLYPFPRQFNFKSRPVRFPNGWKNDRPNLWWKHYLPWIVDRDRLDVFHGPSHFLPALRFGKTVVTIHDIAFLTMDLYPPGVTALMKEMIDQTFKRASRVVAISQNTRRDLEKYGVDPKIIRLIYTGGNIIPEDQIQYQRQQELRDAYRLPERYIVYVGTLGTRKNIPFLLRSYAKLKNAVQVPHGLVLVGKPFQDFDELERLIRELGIERDVIVTGYVEDWQIPLFYTMAELFVLPSRYEGFTLVTLEGMAYGVPVIATDTSSVREGTGDAALLVPVDDDEALATAMRRVLEDHELRRSMIERGRLQACQFTWHECARQTLELYQEVANGEGRK